MVTSMDVANFYINLFKDSDDPMTRMRLSKFLYFAQGWSLVRLGRPLFDDDIKALHYGPVVTTVDMKFKSCGGNQIKNTKGHYSSDVFTLEEVELLLDVAEKYNKYSTGTLSDITHEKDGPWDRVHDDKNCATILNDNIKKYFQDSGEGLPSFLVEEIKRKKLLSCEDKDESELPGDWDDD